MVATFNGNPRSTISCFSPTNVSKETELINFYNELSSLARSIPKHNILIIDGELNTQNGKIVNNKFSLHNSSNRNGEHLKDFRLENRLTCLNSKFQKRKRKLWTYSYSNNAKAPIDSIPINKKWNYSALNCEAYSTFYDVSTDHRIVTAKIRLRLRRNMDRTTSTVQYYWSLLKIRDIRDKSTLALRNKFDPLQEIPETLTVNDEYENFVNAHFESAVECIPPKQRSIPRLSLETLLV